MTYPTGEQYEIRADDRYAVVTEVGATLRGYAVADRPVLRGFAAEERVSGGRGQQLLPWPNRIRDGRYTFAGTQQQLVISEPRRHNASHGLARYVPWTLVEHTTDTVTQQVRVYPQPGWPGILEARLTHQVGPGGLTVTVTVTNLGDTEVPFGYGAHPYLTVGETTVDEVDLTLPAARYLEVDERLLPVAVRPVDGTDRDLRAGGPLGSRNLDTAFTDLAREEDGRWHVRLRLGDRHAELWGDDTMRWLQVFTGENRRDLSVAVEPMTCGPDAFNEGPTHADLIVLGTALPWTGRWGISGG